MNVGPGDLVYIRPGAIDVRTGNIMKRGFPYCEGSGVRCIIQLIDPSFDTHGKYGLANIVTRVKCINKQDRVVWEVQPHDISDNIIYANIEVQTSPTPVEKGVDRSHMNTFDLDKTAVEFIESKPIDEVAFVERNSNFSVIPVYMDNPITEPVANTKIVPGSFMDKPSNIGYEKRVKR